MGFQGFGFTMNTKATSAKTVAPAGFVKFGGMGVGFRI
jgi:hypothetical protein